MSTRVTIPIALCLSLFASISHADEPKEDLHLFLLLGQSNMAGRGKIEEQDKQPDPRVLVFTEQKQWVPAVAPLHFDKPGAGVGPGRTFGIEVAKAKPEVTVGLIPCAHGGSAISSWEPGGYHAQTDGHPYDETLERARAALKSGTLRGILWHQGESDCSPERAVVYEEKLHALIARLREDLDAPNVPFIVGQMGQFPEKPWSAAKRRVDAAHQNLPKRIANTSFVSSDGLTDKGDAVHFDSASYRELGRRFAGAYLEMVE